MSAIRKKKAVPGLVEPNKKTPSFGFDFVVEGARHCGSLRTENRAEAVRLLRGKRRDAKDAAVLKRQARANNDMTWDEAVALYRKSWTLLTPKTIMNIEGYLRNLAPFIPGSTMLSAIDNELMKKLVEGRLSQFRYGKEKLGPIKRGTVNCEVSVVAEVLKNAGDVYLPQKPDWKKHRPTQKPRQREMYIDEEIALEDIRPDVWQCINYMLLSGQRKAAAMLRKDQVYPIQGIIKIFGKGNKFQEVPITPEIEEIISACWDNPTEYVFTTTASRNYFVPHTREHVQKGDVRRLTYGCLSKAWRRICKKAGVRDLRIHDVRKTTGSRIVRCTGDLVAASKLLNHTDIRTTAEHYTYVTTEDLRSRMGQTAVEMAKLKARTNLINDTKPSSTKIKHSHPRFDLTPKQMAERVVMLEQELAELRASLNSMN